VRSACIPPLQRGRAVSLHIWKGSKGDFIRNSAHTFFIGGMGTELCVKARKVLCNYGHHDSWIRTNDVLFWMKSPLGLLRCAECLHSPFAKGEGGLVEHLKSATGDFLTMECFHFSFCARRQDWSCALQWGFSDKKNPPYDVSDLRSLCIPPLQRGRAVSLLPGGCRLSLIYLSTSIWLEYWALIIEH
jgi:hypothetical protein